MRFEDSPIPFLSAASVVLVVLILAIVLIVGSFATGELTDDTINSLLDKQQNISSQISSELDVVVSLASTIDYDRIDDLVYCTASFDIIRSNVDNIKSIYMAVYSPDGVEYFSDMDLRFIPDAIDVFHDSTNIAYGKNWIASYGKPYRDQMGVSTILPVYIIFYSSMEIKAVLCVEIDITQLFFQTCADYEYHDSDYALSIFSGDWLLLDTTDNNPVVVIPVLDDAARLPVDSSERMSLYRTSRYYRVSGGFIELFNTSKHGFVLYGKLSDSYISDRVDPIMFMIVIVGLSALLSLFLITIILFHFKRLRENDIRLKIETIQAKLDPHFLFNTLNSMVSLASEGENEKLISGFRNLSVFLRSSIDIEKFVRLEEEMAFIESYINIQQVRYDGRFTYSCTVADERLLNESIPRFTLQPIIENCFTHGVSVIDEGIVNIGMNVRSEGKFLVIEIVNDAPCSVEDVENARKTSKHPPYGRSHLGIKMIDKEIKLLYGKKYGLDINRLTEGKGFVVQVRLPLSFK